MNHPSTTQPAKKLAIKKQSIIVLSAPLVEHHFPTLDC